MGSDAADRRDPVLDHVGVIVQEFGDARSLLGDYFGLTTEDPELEATLGLEVMWVHAGGVRIELLRPASPDSAAARVLADGHGGVHHLAFAVANLEQAIQDLRARGFRPRADGIRAGARGNLICFLDPTDAQGMVVELVQHVGRVNEK